MGVRDDAAAVRGPRVISPDYVQIPANCLEVPTFDSRGCPKGCEGLLGLIVRGIGSSFGSWMRWRRSILAQLDAVAEQQLLEVASVTTGPPPMRLGTRFPSCNHDHNDLYCNL